MKRMLITLLFTVFSCGIFAQDWLSLFLGSANKYASVELSDYRKRLCIEYNIRDSALDDYYRRCGKNWGNVGLMLEIAKTSGKKMDDVCDYYKRYRRYGWERILRETGIRPGTPYYRPFCNRMHYHHDIWDKHYKHYCDRYGKHHPKNHKYRHDRKHNRKHDNGRRKRHDRWDD